MSAACRRPARRSPPRSLLWALAVATLAAAWPSAALAGAVNASATLAYALQRSQELGLSSSQSLREELRLSLAEALLAHGLLFLEAGGRYSNADTWIPTGQLGSHVLDYGVRALALQESPLRLGLDASRKTESSSVEVAQAEEFAGAARTSDYSGEASLELPDAPRVRLSVRRRDVLAENRLGDTAELGQTVSELRVAQSSAVLSYGLTGRLLEADGSRPGTAYRSVEGQLHQRALLTDALRFEADGALFRRLAERTELGNPDYLSARAGLRVELDASQAWRNELTYSYNRHVLEEASLAGADDETHGLAGTARLQLDADTRVDGGVFLTTSTLRRDDVRYGGHSEGLRAQAERRWPGELVSWDGTAGAHAGYSASRGEEGGLLAGGEGSIGASGALAERLSVGGLVRGAYSEERSALRRRQTSGGVSLHASAAPSFGTSINWQASGDFGRQSSSLDESRRSLHAGSRANLTFGGENGLQLEYQYADDTSAFLRDPLAPFALPARLNVQTHTFSGGLTWLPAQNLSSSLQGHWAKVRSATQRQQSLGLVANVDYVIGKLVLRLTYRGSRDASDGRTALGHYVFASVSRSFAWDL